MLVSYLLRSNYMSKQSPNISSESFIDAYKAYEAAVRDVCEMMPLDFENSQDQSLKKKLQIIRMERNFIQHENAPDFIQVTAAQMETLKEVTDALRRRQGVVKDAMITIRKYGCVYDDDTLQDAIHVLATIGRDDLVVIKRETSEVLGFFMKDAVISCINEDTPLKTKMLTSGRSKYQIPLQTEYQTIDENEAMCTVNQSITYIVYRGKRAVGVLPATL